MNQPGLGLKVSELRQQKGLTQEQLAERCEVSARTIQRIESGEVDPRAYTLHCLGEALEFDFSEQNTGNENFWLAILHLSSIFCVLVIPLLLWSWKKNQSYKIDQQGRHVLNFQITMTLSLFAALFFMVVGLPTLILLSMDMDGFVILASTVAILSILPFMFIGIFCTYQGVVNAMRSLSDKPIRYALTIPFVK
ncbi:MAG TPA: helix-turn-helix domain-containing protein [Anaerolineales bacterium]|nr:helix-turn-helix domain-containing protein [Anaerolineales bacterium]